MQKSYSRSEKKISSKTILSHVVSVKIVENTAALDTSRLSQAAFKNSYAQYSAIAKAFDDYDLPRTQKLVWRAQRVEDLVDIALKQYGMRVQRPKTRVEIVDCNMYNIIIHMVMEELDNEQ